VTPNDSGSGASLELESAIACPFDHHSRAYANHWPTILKRLRAEAPVCYTSAHGGFHVVTRYDDVASVARDDDAYSSAWEPEGPRRGVSIPPTPHRFGFIMMDPPTSTAYRRSLMPMFTAKAAQRLIPHMRRFAQEALDDLLVDDEFDIVSGFCDRLPAMTVTHMLGLDIADWKRYVTFFHHSVSDDHADPVYDETFGPDNWVLRKLRDSLLDRRRDARDDGLTWVLNREVNGRPMTLDEAIETVILIMIGGFDTSSALLANSILYLSQFAADRQFLIENPNRLPSACEEFLRFFSPVQNLARTVNADCELGGQHLQAGERLLLSWASANRDDAVFPDADSVVLDRFPNRHQAFGLGTHRCVGSHIARAEFVVGMSEILTRMPSYQVLIDQSERYESIGSNNGWMSMRVRANVSSTSRPSKSS
jgi:cytochrome P450